MEMMLRMRVEAEHVLQYIQYMECKVKFYKNQRAIYAPYTNKNKKYTLILQTLSTLGSHITFRIIEIQRQLLLNWYLVFVRTVTYGPERGLSDWFSWPHRMHCRRMFIGTSETLIQL